MRRPVGVKSVFSFFRWTSFFSRAGKKRAIVATARKLAVLLHHLWVSGEGYEPLHNSSRTTVAAAA